MRFNSKEIFTVPNIMTYFRIALVPVFIWLIFDAAIVHHVMIAFGIFLLASATDMLDGYIARRFNQISDIGKVLDPFADKLLQVTTLLCLAIIGRVHYAFVIVLFVKEFYMVLGGSVIIKVFKSNYVVEANIFGKAATLANTLGIVLCFFHEPKYNNMYYVDWAILGVGTALAVVAAVVYTVKFIQYRKIETSEKDDNQEKTTEERE